MSILSHRKAFIYFHWQKLDTEYRTTFGTGFNTPASSPRLRRLGVVSSFTVVDTSSLDPSLKSPTYDSFPPTPPPSPVSVDGGLGCDAETSTSSNAKPPSGSGTEAYDPCHSNIHQVSSTTNESSFSRRGLCVFHRYTNVFHAC